MARRRRGARKARGLRKGVGAGSAWDHGHPGCGPTCRLAVPPRPQPSEFKLAAAAAAEELAGGRGPGGRGRARSDSERLRARRVCRAVRRAVGPAGPPAVTAPSLHAAGPGRRLGSPAALRHPTALPPPFAGPPEAAWLSTRLGAGPGQEDSERPNGGVGGKRPLKRGRVTAPPDDGRFTAPSGPRLQPFEK